MIGVRLVLLAALMLCLAPSTAVSAPGDEIAQARQHYGDGERHFNLAEYQEALVDFKEAYRLKPDAVFLYNIGQCHRKLGHVDDALTFYRNYLRLSSSAPNRAEVERRIHELEVEQAAKQARPAPEAQAAGEATTATEAKVAAAAQAADKVKPAAEAKPPADAQPASETQAQQSEPASVAPAPPPLSTPLPPAAPEPSIDRAAASLALDQPPGEVAPKPSIFHRWWFWTGAGAAVVTGVVVGVLATRGGGTTPFCPECLDSGGVHTK
jgi:tetratricopeptide (TPR) repeat protein